MQLKSLAKSTEVLNKVTSVLNNTELSSIAIKKELETIGKSYTTETLKTALAQSTLNKEQIKVILSANGLQGELLETTADELANAASTNAVAASQAASTTTTLGLGDAFKELGIKIKETTTSLWTFLTTNPLGWATMAIGAIASVFGIMKLYENHLEKIRQATEEAANTYKDATSSIEDYTSRYQELHEALLAAKGNEEETYNIKKQLLDLQTELNDKFGEEYGKLNLVTDAYRDQTDAIKAYNKEAAQTYLNENKKGIDSAAKEMTKKRSYNLSNTGISEFTDEGKTLKEIAEKYNEKGISLNYDENGGTFKIVLLDVDAKSAYDTINSFETDLRNKARELGNENLFDDVLKISSSSLNDVKDTIDANIDLYKSALEAEIITDDGKGGKLEVYEDLKDAVEEYNEAELKSDDIYNDEDVAKAKSHLDDIREAIQNNEEEWGKYSIVINEVLENANTKMLDFYNTLKNDSTIQDLIKELEGLTATEAQAIANARDNKNSGGEITGLSQAVLSATNDYLLPNISSFNGIIDKAKELGICMNDSAEETQKLIDLLIELGVVQDDITSGENVIDTPKWDYSTTIENLDKVKEKMDVLDASYAKLFDSSEQIGFDDLSSIHDAFSDVAGIDQYVKRLQEAGQNADAVKSAMEDLIGAYLEHTEILSNVTDENQELIISMLEEMGIMNAEEIVLAQLSQNAEMLAIQKQFAADNGYEFANATISEAAALLQEVSASEVTTQLLARLALEKIHVNGQTINTSADIDNVIALANAAQASTEVLSQLAKAKTILAYDERTGMGFTLGDDYKEARSLMKEISSGTYDYQFKAIDPDLFKATSAPKLDPQYAGGVKSLANAEKNLGKATKDANEALKKQEEALEKQKEALEESKNELEELYDAVQWFYDKQLDGIDDFIEKLEDTNEALEKQKDNYDNILVVIDDVYNDEINAIQAKIDAMDKANDASEKEIALEKAKQALIEARNRRAIKVKYMPLFTVM